MVTKSRNEDREITSVSQLLETLDPGLSPPMQAAVKTMSRHLARCLDTPLDQMPVGALIDADHVLAAYLREQQRYKQSSIDCYRKAARFVFRCAKRLECLSQNAEIPEDWQSIFAAAKTEGCAQIVRYAIRQGIPSTTFSDRDLDRWGEILIARKRQAAYAISMKNLFRSVIRRYGLGGALPLLSPQRNYRYGIPTASMPSTLQQEIKDILAFKQGLVWAPGLPRRARQGPVSAAGLEGEFCQLYGFAVRILGINVGSLADLITETVVTEFAGWLINERKVFRQSVMLLLASIYAGVRYYRAFRSTDFQWLQELIAEIDPEPDSERQERKRRKCLPYTVVEEIPVRLRERRNGLSQAKNPEEWAFLLHDELMMTWLLTLPWRGRNLRECTVGLEEEGANLFKQPLSAMVNIDLPDSVKDKLRANPDEPIWQFKFLASQTKKKRMVCGGIPVLLVPLLEEYLPYRRELLARTGQDHDRLFINRNGLPLSSDDITTLVKRLTLKYAGREISPHLFRSIYAYQWLRENSREYPKLSGLLWHRSVDWTIRVYGSNFNESSAVCEAEAWLLRRQAAKACGSALGNTGEENAAAPRLVPIEAQSADASTVEIAAGTEQKAKPKKPAAPKLSRADQGRAARAEGTCLFNRAGRPTEEQLVLVYGKLARRMTWQERAKAAGLPNAEAAAVAFQAALAAKLSAERR